MVGLVALGEDDEIEVPTISGGSPNFISGCPFQQLRIFTLEKGQSFLVDGSIRSVEDSNRLETRIRCLDIRQDINLELNDPVLGVEKFQTVHRNRFDFLVIGNQQIV